MSLKTIDVFHTEQMKKIYARLWVDSQLMEQMILDDERGDNDLDKKIKILETQNKILQAEKKFLADTLKEHGILTMK